MTVTTSANPFAQFGQSIAAARLAVGLGTQADAAPAYGVTQQTVSRWEAGTHRPRSTQLPTIAAVLQLNVADLRQLLGEDALPGMSFAKPLPLDGLAPDTFEQFVADLYHYLHPLADVRRAGGSGHDQDGIDVRAVHPDGRKTDIQCKRVAQFGSAKVREVVRVYKADGDEQILALSRIASPEAAAEVSAHGWKLWDRDDMSRLLRQLAPDIQDRLVDIYFRGRRLELLGRNEPGPWLTLEEFFRPFEGKRVFNHDEALVAREEELGKVAEALRRGDALTLITAPAGMGKSRFAMEAVGGFQKAEPATLVRFLSSAAPATREALESLGAGSKLIVVDDAHDRNGLNVLFEYAADKSRMARLLLLSRPYAVARLRSEAAIFGIPTPDEVALPELTRAQLETLCAGILEEEGAEPEWAGEIVRASGRSPLVATMAARIVARSGRPLELARGDAGLRDVVMGKFARILTGEIDGSGDHRATSKALNVIALIQPFHPQDSEVTALFERVIGIDAANTAEILRALSDGGVILERGQEWRLMPDVLGDYLIEKSALDALGQLSPLAQQVLDGVAQSAMLKNVLLNLGRLDWRRNDGDTTRSLLLDRAWRQFDTITDGDDHRLGAVQAVAIYQPKHAMDFVTRALQRQVRLPVFVEILRSIFYSGKLGDDALHLLWDLGKEEPRDRKTVASPAIKMLCELAGYDERKPRLYSEQLLDFAFVLVGRQDCWTWPNTPLDLMAPLLSFEGVKTRSSGRQIVMSAFYVAYEAVQPLRARIIDLVLGLLTDARPRVAAEAAGFLDKLVQAPHGLVGSRPSEALLVACHHEFAETLVKLRRIVEEGRLEAVTLVGVARAMGWLAAHAPDEVAAHARAILDARPNSLDYRITASLIDGHTHFRLGDKGIDDWQARLEAWHSNLGDALIAAMPDAATRLTYLNAIFERVTAAGEDRSTGNVLVGTLVTKDLDFANLLAVDALANPARATAQYSGMALNKVMRDDRVSGRALATQFISAGQGHQAAASLERLDSYGPEELALIEQLLAAPDAQTVGMAIHIVWNSVALGVQQRVNLLAGAQLRSNAMLADNLSMMLTAQVHEGGPLIGHLSMTQAERLLSELETITELDGYWIDELLADFSFRFPIECADFFMRRVEAVGRARSFRIRAANSGPYSKVRLRFSESAKADAVLGRTWAWLQSHHAENVYFKYAASDMFQAMFMFDTGTIVRFFAPFVPTASERDVDLINRILRGAASDFVFDQSGFVIAYLDRCQQLGADALKDATEALFGSTIGGIRSGAVGEPTAEDLSDRDRSDVMLKGLSRLSPAYRLYEQIRDFANGNIAQSIADGEALDREAEQDA